MIVALVMGQPVSELRRMTPPELAALRELYRLRTHRADNRLERILEDEDPDNPTRGETQ